MLPRMIALTLEWDRDSLRHARTLGAERALVRTVSRAGGDALRAMRARSKKTVRERKRMKAGRVQRSLPIAYPVSSQSLDTLVWTMGVSNAPIPLSEYPWRATKRGVSVSINRGQRARIQGAFAATMKSGHEGIFTRRGKARLPIGELFSSRVSDVFGDPDVIPEALGRAQAVFSATVARLLPAELTRSTL